MTRCIFVLAAISCAGQSILSVRAINPGRAMVAYALPAIPTQLLNIVAGGIPLRTIECEDYVDNQCVVTKTSAAVLTKAGQSYQMQIQAKQPDGTWGPLSPAVAYTAPSMAAPSSGGLAAALPQFSPRLTASYGPSSVMLVLTRRGFGLALLDGSGSIAELPEVSWGEQPSVAMTSASDVFVSSGGTVWHYAITTAPFNAQLVLIDPGFAPSARDMIALADGRLLKIADANDGTSFYLEAAVRALDGVWTKQNVMLPQDGGGATYAFNATATQQSDGTVYIFTARDSASQIFQTVIGVNADGSITTIRQSATPWVGAGDGINCPYGELPWLISRLDPNTGSVALFYPTGQGPTGNTQGTDIESATIARFFDDPWTLKERGVHIGVVLADGALGKRFLPQLQTLQEKTSPFSAMVGTGFYRVAVTPVQGPGGDMSFQDVYTADLPLGATAWTAPVLLGTSDPQPNPPALVGTAAYLSSPDGKTYAIQIAAPKPPAPAPPPAQLAIAPNPAPNLHIGQCLQFTANVVPITWSETGPGTIRGGLYCAPQKLSGRGNKTVTVTATSGAQSARVTVLLIP